MNAPASSSLTFGACLPSFRVGASRDGIEATVDAADRLGWSTVWSTDHLLPDTSKRAQDYWSVFESVTTLAYAAGRNGRVGLGLSVLVVPMRNAVEQAKTLATIDNLSRGRLTVGVGIGWSETEYGNVGMADRFRVRGAYLDEAIRLWRHLWSGSQEPFHGRFHSFEDFRFAPLPERGEDLPVLVGGSATAALRRAGKLGDGFHSSGTGPVDYGARAGAVRSAASEARRREPILQARCQVLFDKPATGFYALSGGTDAMVADVKAFRELGVSHLALDLRETEPDRVVAAMERFDREVAQPAVT